MTISTSTAGDDFYSVADTARMMWTPERTVRQAIARGPVVLTINGVEVVCRLNGRGKSPPYRCSQCGPRLDVNGCPHLQIATLAPTMLRADPSRKD